MTDVQAVPMSPTAVSSRDPNAIIYDGRPSILPVSISLADLAGDDVVVTVDLPSVMVGRVVGRLQQGIQNRQSYRKSQVTLILIWRMKSADFPTIYDQYGGGDDIAVTISGTSGARRALGSFLYAGVSWEAYSPGTLNVFPTYVPSPDVSLYVPTTSPVTPAQILDTEFLSLDGPASMDSLIAGDSYLMDRDQDLLLLPFPLLPLPDHFAGYGPGAEFYIRCWTVTARYW